MPLQRRKRRTTHLHNLYQDLGIIALSVLIAGLLSISGTMEILITSLGQAQLVGILLAGVLFTSIFTTAPAIVILGTLAQHYPLWLVATLGTVGALAGDYIIFHFVRDHFSDDVLSFLTQHRHRQIRKILRLPAIRWVCAMTGMLLIASPLPDELGIALLGFAKTRPSVFTVASGLGNFVGIMAIGLVAQTIR